MNTREKLIRSAIKLFSEKGFEATSTTSICSDAGFSSGALFVHFSSKNELLDTIYLDIKKEYFIAAQKNIDFESGVMDILHQGAFQGVKYYVENPNKFIFMKKFLNSPHLARVAEEVMQGEAKAALDLFDAGKRQGCIKDIDNDLIVCLLTNATYGLIEYYINQKKPPREEDISTLLTFIKK